MTTTKHSGALRAVALVTMALFALSGVAPAQTPPPATAAPAAPPGAAPPAEGASDTFTQAELEQILAPIALYPDELFVQVLMASTYPLDIVSADRWVKANPKLKDKALEDALQKQPWDPSVKSLAVFPQVLSMMSEKLDWTQKLGDAFLGQKEDVMKTAQALRQKADATGNLKDSKEVKVVKEVENNTTVIKIEPSDPQVVYVPTYNPSVVYGAWPYPAYPPYYYYPPGYVAGAAFWSFTAGVIVGGALWGGCNWGRGDVNVNVNRYNNFNKTNISNGNWNHNSDRRGAVPYKNQKVSQQYNRGGGAGSQARDQYRGRDTGGAGNRAGTQQAGARDAGGRGGGAGGGDFNRGGAGGGDFSRAGASATGAGNRSAFDSGGRSGAQTRDASSRGSSSMGSARSSGYSGGGARAGGGGGGARGGGGGRGGGGRR